VSDQWTAIQRLIGRWQGTASGEPGTGRQVRVYESALRGKFITGRNRTEWEPTTEDPDGEIHEDTSYIGFDKAAGQLVMRSFFVEGFYCEYRCIEMAADGSRFVFEADSVENGPSGLRARESLTFIGTDRLESAFALAEGGADFATYSTESLRRL
jgi:hypothetical protein